MIIKKLFESGGNIDKNYCKPTTRMTALHWLAYNNDEKAMKVLFERSADIFAFNHDG